MPATRDRSVPPSKSQEAERPDPMRQMQDLAEAGDFGGLIKWLVDVPPGACDLGVLDRLLRHAVEQASRRSPRRFTAEVFRQTTACVTYVNMRLQVCAMLCLAAADTEGYRRRTERPVEMLKEVLPAIERLSRLAGELCQGQASTARLWELAKRNRVPKLRKHKTRRSGDDHLPDLYDEGCTKKPEWVPDDSEPL
jgi:hypothetical protein